VFRAAHPGLVLFWSRPYDPPPRLVPFHNPKFPFSSPLQTFFYFFLSLWISDPPFFPDFQTPQNSRPPRSSLSRLAILITMNLWMIPRRNVSCAPTLAHTAGKDAMAFDLAPQVSFAPPGPLKKMGDYYSTEYGDVLPPVPPSIQPLRFSRRPPPPPLPPLIYTHMPLHALVHLTIQATSNFVLSLKSKLIRPSSFGAYLYKALSLPLPSSPLLCCLEIIFQSGHVPQPSCQDRSVSLCCCSPCPKSPPERFRFRLFFRPTRWLSQAMGYQFFPCLITDPPMRSLFTFLSFRFGCDLS